MTTIKTNTWVQLIAITSLVILYSGYLFNIYDQEDHLPQIYKLLSPELYSSDFFVNEYFKTFNVRFFYVSIVYLFSKAIGVYLSVAILHIICLFATVLYTYKLAKVIGASEIASLGASLLLPTLFNTYNLGLSNLIYSSFIAGNIATPLCLYAFYKYFDNKLIWAGVGAGLACLFQVLMGIQVFLIILTTCLIFYNKNRIKNIVFYFFAFIIFSSPMLIPIFQQQFFSPKLYDDNLVVLILTLIRNPHHYVPSLFPVTDYLKFASIVALGLISTKLLPKPKADKIYIIYGIVILGMLVYYIGFEKLSINLFAKTQWFKASIWITLFSVIAISSFLFSFLENTRLLHFYRKYSLSLSLIAIVISCFIIFNSAAIPVKRFQNFYHLGNFRKSDLTLMHEWIKKNTDVDAIFIIPPNDESFLCEAQRSTMVSYKPMIHQEKYQVDWLNKMMQLCGITIEELKDGNAKKTLLLGYYDNMSNFASFNPDYIIANKSDFKFKPNEFPIVYEAGSWILLKK